MSDTTAEDVVLYDIDMDAPLEDLYRNPETRWYAVKVMAKNGFTAASNWNPLLHPRGPDGRFIEVFGWVRWFSSKTGKWTKGQVKKIDTDGSIHIDTSPGDGKPGKSYKFSHLDASKKLFAAAAVKAKLSLPDLQKPGNDDKWEKTGGQGGSNLGGFFKTKVDLGKVADAVEKIDMDAPAFIDGVEGKFYSLDDMNDDKVPPPMNPNGAQSFYFVGKDGDLYKLHVKYDGGIVDKTKPSTLTKFEAGAVDDPGENLSSKALEIIPEDAKFFLPKKQWAEISVNGKIMDVPVDNPHIDTPEFRAAFLEGEIDKTPGDGGGVDVADVMIPQGTDFYIKKSKSKEHAANEILANRLYEAAGVPVADVYLGDDDQTIASRIVPFEDTKLNIGDALDDPEVMSTMRENMVVDAWLANWDVVGLGLENVQVLDGVPYRIDAGGALLYRAQGSPKGSNFGPEVGELETLRNPSMNHQAAKVFGAVTDEELLAGAKKVASVSPDEIRGMVDEYGLDEDLADTLIARRQFIIDKFDIPDPWHADPEIDFDAPDKHDNDVDVHTPDAEVTNADLAEAFANSKVDKIVTKNAMNSNGETFSKSFDGQPIFEVSTGKLLTDGTGSDSSWVQSTYLSSDFQEHVVIESSDGSIKTYLADDLTHVGTLNTNTPDVHLPETDTAGTPDVKVPDAVSTPQTETEIAVGGKIWYSSLVSGKTEWVDTSMGYKMTPEERREYLIDKITGDDPWVSTDYMYIPDTEKGDLVYYLNQLWVIDEKTMGFDGDDTATLQLVGYEDIKVTVGPNEPYPRNIATLTVLGGDKTSENDLKSTYAAMVNSYITNAAMHPDKWDDLITKDLNIPVEPTTSDIGDPEFVSAHPMAVGHMDGTWFVFDTGPANESPADWKVSFSNNLWAQSDLSDGGIVWLSGLGKFARTHHPGKGDSDHFYVTVDGEKRPLTNNDVAGSVYHPATQQHALGGELFKALYTVQEDMGGDLDVEPSFTQTEVIKDALDAKPDSGLDVGAAFTPDVKSEFLFSVGDLLNAAALPDNQHSEVYKSLTTALEGKSPSEVVGIEFLQEIIGEVHPITKTSKGIQNNHIEIIKSDLAKIGAEGILHPPVYETPAPGGGIPAVVEGFHPSVIPGTKLTLSDIEEDKVKRVGSSLVGKTVYLIPSDAEPDDYVGVVGTSKYTESPNKYHAGNIKGLFYVDEFKEDTNRLVLRTSTGGTIHVPLNPDIAWESDLYDMTEMFPPDMFAKSPDAVLKKDGTITLKGKVIGKWSKNNWTNYYSYVIDADHSITGYDIKGQLGKKSHVKVAVGLNVIPPPAKPEKKKSAAKEAVEAVKQAISKDIPGSPILSTGEEAKLGNWVQSTKGGGGFVGKIVGWPDQDQHPGLAFAVSKDGIQKIVKLKTQKLVPEPDDIDGISLVDGVPSAYVEHKFGDGSVPKVGQHVKAGTPGKEIEGIVTNMNLEQGFVYILTPDGKTKSKTFSVTTVLNEPDLIWDPDVPAVVKLGNLETPATPGTPNGDVLYPAPDGGTIVQPLGLVESYEDAVTKKSSLPMSTAKTKDGYVPTPGMHVKDKDGNSFVIVGTYTEVSADVELLSTDFGNPSKIVPINSVYVDHAQELQGFAGNPTLEIKGINYLTHPDGGKFPEGTVLYAVPVGSGKNEFFVVDPQGDMFLLEGTTPSIVATKVSSNYVLQLYYGPKSSNLAKFHASEMAGVQKVGTFGHPGSDTGVNVVVHPGDFDTPNPGIWWNGMHNPEAEKPTPTPTPSKPSVSDEVAGISDAAEDIVDDAAKASGLGYEGVDPGNIDLATLPNMADLPSPETVDQPHLKPVTPPSPPVKVDSDDIDKPLPEVTGATPDLSKTPTITKGTKAKSVAQAAADMVANKDSTKANTGLTYAIGDSDLVEDMLFRYNVEVRDGQEHLVLRFRLREDQSEDLVDHLLGQSSGQMKGAWKKQGAKYPTDLMVGDAIAIKVGHNATKDNEPMLKPVGADSPNARVVKAPELVGKSPGPKGNGEFAVFRVRVRTEDGLEGDVDIQYRPGGSIEVFEWDKEAPVENSSSSGFSLTPTAQDVGWERKHGMSYDGSKYSVHTDETGKFVVPSNVTTDELATHNGGQRFTFRDTDGSIITFNAAHSTESGIGNEAIRRSNAAGEVRISVPLEGKSEEELLATMSRGMERVGIPPEAQVAPSDEQVAILGLSKLVSQFHPKYDYRGAPISGADDKRVQETLEHMTKTIGHDVTLDDIRVHTHDDGRVQFVFSPEVASAIAKKQGSDYYVHSGASEVAHLVLGGQHPGILSADERWSLGILNEGLSAHQDIRTGAGDRVYVRGVTGKNPDGRKFIINPTVFAMGMESYTNIAASGGGTIDGEVINPGTGHDAWGKRGNKNKYIETTAGFEVMYKRAVGTDFISAYVANSQAEKNNIIKKLKKSGVTHIGGRPLDQVILTSSEAQTMMMNPGWETGDGFLDPFANDPSLGTILSGGAGVAQAAGDAAGSGAGGAPV